METKKDICLHLGCGRVYLKDDNLDVINVDVNWNESAHGIENDKHGITLQDYMNKPISTQDHILADVAKDILDFDYYESLIEFSSIKRIVAFQILEHFPEDKILDILKFWVGLLNDGGELYLSVPDIQEASNIIAHYPEQRNKMYRLIYGGQSDENDFHKSAYDKDKVYRLFKLAGLRIEFLNSWYWHPAVCVKGIKL